MSLSSMLRPTRLLAALATVLLCAPLAQADVWRLSHKMTPESIEGRVHQLFADRVKEHTKGKIEIRIFPNEQLGKDQAVLEQVRAGTVHIFVEAPAYLQQWVPEMQWMGAPFVFADRDHWVRFMKTPLVQSWVKQVEDKAGIMILGDPTAMVRGPWAVMVSRKPWKNLAEMQKIKLRMHQDALNVKAWSYLGAEVRVINWTDTYEALSNGVVDAVNTEIALLEPMKFYEVVPYIIKHDYKPAGLAYMTNAKAYRALTPDLQKALMTAYDQAAKFQVEITLKETGAAIERIKAKGGKFIDDVDRSGFVDKMAQFYNDMAKRGELPKGLMEAINATR
jgi:tripartite ATP-independent transporter DctP family solute receptor